MDGSLLPGRRRLRCLRFISLVTFAFVAVDCGVIIVFFCSTRIGCLDDQLLRWCVWYKLILSGCIFRNIHILPAFFFCLRFLMAYTACKRVFLIWLQRLLLVVRLDLMMYWSYCSCAAHSSVWWWAAVLFSQFRGDYPILLWSVWIQSGVLTQF